jgi:SAM-dependent methyltransferase
MAIDRLKTALAGAIAATRNAAVPAADGAPEDGGTTMLPFRCNLCGTHNRVPLAALERETPSCRSCGSTVRFRSIVHLLKQALFGYGSVLADLPPAPDVVGIGLSDADAYASRLAAKLGYTNTYFHTEPRLDIANAPAELTGRYDFLIASDVFEHVVPPVSQAFANARRILKPGGVFVFSVPFGLDEETVEHYPDLAEFRIAEEQGGWTLRNRTTDGREQVYTDLVFHGGPGTTLEMRLFSLPALQREFARAGFSSMRVAGEACLEHGILWTAPWSVPIVARA